MAGFINGVDMRTQVAGENRLEMLLFHLQGRQRFGINVFKVKEVVQCPHLTEIPGSSLVVRGVASLRGVNIPVLDLSHAIGGPMMGAPEDHFLIITEYNRNTLGFLVGSVDRIINVVWENILAPPVGMGRGTYMTAVTQVEDELIEILDVEKVLSEVLGIDETFTQPVPTHGVNLDKMKVMVVDDSVVARKQIQRVLDKIGLTAVMKKDGSEALSQLQEWAEEGRVSDWLAMVISDIEMPKMDGYTMVRSIRENSQLADLHVIMHSSLNGIFNKNMINKVGADQFLAKFNPDELAGMVTERLNELA